MRTTDRLGDILSCYGSDHPGVLTRLARMLKHGRRVGLPGGPRDRPGLPDFIDLDAEQPRRSPRSPQRPGAGVVAHRERSRCAAAGRRRRWPQNVSRLGALDHAWRAVPDDRGGGESAGPADGRLVGPAWRRREQRRRDGARRGRLPGASRAGRGKKRRRSLPGFTRDACRPSAPCGPEHIQRAPHRPILGWAARRRSPP